MLFPHTYAWLTSHCSALSSGVTPSERPLLTTHEAQPRFQALSLSLPSSFLSQAEILVELLLSPSPTKEECAIGENGVETCSFLQGHSQRSDPFKRTKKPLWDSCCRCKSRLWLYLGSHLKVKPQLLGSELGPTSHRNSSQTQHFFLMVYLLLITFSWFPLGGPHQEKRNSEHCFLTVAVHGKESPEILKLPLSTPHIGRFSQHGRGSVGAGTSVCLKAPQAFLKFNQVKNPWISALGLCVTF